MATCVEVALCDRKQQHSYSSHLSEGADAGGSRPNKRDQSIPSLAPRGAKPLAIFVFEEFFFDKNK
jgi:hypothetical protein